MIKRELYLKGIFLLLFLSYGQLILAQIVNIENKRTALADTVGWFGQLDLGFQIVKNKQTVMTIRGSNRVDFLHHRHSAFSLTDYNFVKAGESEFVNQGFQHFRYNYKFNEKWTGEWFTQAQYNERIRIKLRALLGIGGRFQLVEKENAKAYTGLAYMYEYEEISDTSIIHRNHRLSTYFSFNLKIRDYLTLSNTSYYQPLVNDFSNFRLTTATQLDIKITKQLSLKSKFNLTYDSRLHEEVSDIPATIYSLTNGLSWYF